MEEENQKECSEFCGAYAQIAALNTSGTTEEDTVAEAVKLLVRTKLDIYKGEFNRLACWRILKDEPKWKNLINPVDVSRDEDTDDLKPAADRPLEVNRPNAKKWKHKDSWL